MILCERMCAAKSRLFIQVKPKLGGNGMHHLSYIFLPIFNLTLVGIFLAHCGTNNWFYNTMTNDKYVHAVQMRMSPTLVIRAALFFGLQVGKCFRVPRERTPGHAWRNNPRHYRQISLLINLRSKCRHWNTKVGGSGDFLVGYTIRILRYPDNRRRRSDCRMQIPQCL